MARYALFAFSCCLVGTQSFATSGSHTSVIGRAVRSHHMPCSMAAREAFDLTVDLQPRGKARLRFKPSLPESEAVVVKYKLPFGLNVENKGGQAVCTKDGEGGEKVGDILRYTTEWKLGLPAGDGAITTAASFAGAISWQLGLFDVAKAKAWDEVVEALVSNTEDRTDTITLVFERPL